MSDSKFVSELVIVICNHGFADEIVEASREGGGRGATILHGRGSATPDMAKFLGVTIFPDKDVVLIVTKSEVRNSIMKEVMKRCGESDAHALCFSLPVTDTIGLS